MISLLNTLKSMIILFTSFRLFADDVKIFYTSDDVNDIESVMNCEMTRVLNYYAINKLSVNMKKTNFMLITSPR